MTDNLPTPYHATAMSLHRMLMPDRESDLIRSHCRSGSEYEFGKLMMLNPPTQDQRGKLDKRHRDIAASLSEHNPREIAAAVADVMGCYRNFIKPDEDPKKVIAKYVKELHGIPTWACVRACTAIRNNEAPKISREFPFSTLALRDLAESYIRRLQDEAREISEIVRGGVLPPPAPPEMRARVQRKLERLAYTMKAGMRRDHDAMVKPMLARMSNEETIIRDYRKRGDTPVFANGVLVSPQLLEQLKQRGVSDAGGIAEGSPDQTSLPK